MTNGSFAAKVQHLQESPKTFQKNMLLLRLGNKNKWDLFCIALDFS